MKDRTNELLEGELCTAAIEEIVRLNKGLVGKQLKRFGLVQDPNGLSYGFEALYKAIITYDPNKNSSFSTYASVCIYNSLGSYVRSTKTMILSNTVSYDKPLDSEGNTMLHYLPSGDSADGDVLQKSSVRSILCVVDSYIGTVRNEAQRSILREWRRGMFELPHREIAATTGYSQSYVSRTINTARKILRGKLEALM